MPAWYEAIHHSARRELAFVSAGVAAVSAILFWRSVPLPHGDLSFFTEPAYMLAKFGRLASPGSQFYDLTYLKGFYGYPPGYFLILAGWIRLFGFSADSLLAYTHLVHTFALILLWALLRSRYHCSRTVSALVLLAMFPRMTHGRPDLTATALSLAAWLMLPDEVKWQRIVASGFLGGAALLVSPALGVATIATLVILMLVNSQQHFRLRLRAAIVWLACVGILFGSVTAAVLTQQHSWTLAYVQFKTNVAIRGASLNALPHLFGLFGWTFCIVPFGLVALLPAVLVVSGYWKETPQSIRKLGLVFLGGTAVWLAINKSQLLLEYHFIYPAKSAFVGLFYSWPKLPAYLRITPLALLCAISFYFYKAGLLYLATPLRLEEKTYAQAVHPKGITAVDSLYFSRLYKPGQVLNLAILSVGKFWASYRDAIPPYARQEMLEGLPSQPSQPNMILFTAYGTGTLRFPDVVPGCEQIGDFRQKLRVLHRTWNLPAHPYSLLVCTTNSAQSAAAIIALPQQ